MSSGDNYVADGPAQIGWNSEMQRLEVSMPHQCGEWVIGDADAVRVMIADLATLLPEFEHPEKYRHEHICVQCERPVIERLGSCSRTCLVIYRDGLCQTCSAAQWQATDAARRAAEREKLRSFPQAGAE